MKKIDEIYLMITRPIIRPIEAFMNWYERRIWNPMKKNSVITITVIALITLVMLILGQLQA